MARARASILGRPLILSLVSHIVFDILESLRLADGFPNSHSLGFLGGILIAGQITREVTSSVFLRRPFPLGPGALIPYLRPMVIATTILIHFAIWMAGIIFSTMDRALLMTWRLLFGLLPPSYLIFVVQFPAIRLGSRDFPFPYLTVKASHCVIVLVQVIIRRTPSAYVWLLTNILRGGPLSALIRVVCISREVCLGGRRALEGLIQLHLSLNVMIRGGRYKCKSLMELLSESREHCLDSIGRIGYLGIFLRLLGLLSLPE